jgi:hypothetical protein
MRMPSQLHKPESLGQYRSLHRPFNPNSISLQNAGQWLHAVVLAYDLGSSCSL